MRLSEIPRDTIVNKVKQILFYFQNDALAFHGFASQGYPLSWYRMSEIDFGTLPAEDGFS